MVIDSIELEYAIRELQRENVDLRIQVRSLQAKIGDLERKIDVTAVRIRDHVNLIGENAHEI